MDCLKISTLYIELTHACNQHCYLNGGIHYTVAEMTSEQIKKIFRKFKEQGGRSAIITGGEPLVRKVYANSDLGCERRGGNGRTEVFDCISRRV